MKESLLKSDVIYDQLLAFQLDSPTSNEVRSFFQHNQDSLRDCPVFTIFFSGHGDIRDGKFYICPTDYSPEFPSASGIPISDLIRYARDLKIGTLNIVLDACRSGQAGADLREAIERPARENNSSLCVSILASCLPDQSSVTGNPLSAFTKLLNDFIVGSKDPFVNRRFLTLGDISQLMPAVRHAAGSRQTVVHYALNVLGPARFCANPLLNERQRQPHNALLSPHSSLGEAALNSKEALEAVYTSIGNGFRHEKLISALRPVCDNSGASLLSLDELLDHYFEWFGTRAKKTPDWSLPLRVSASLATASLAVGWETDFFVKSRALGIARSLHTDLQVLRKVLQTGDLEPLGLLSSQGISPFYYAPIRLSHCYARMGLCLIAANLGYLDSAEVNLQVDGVTKIIQEKVPALHLILNETQGPHIGIFFAACALTNNHELAEFPFGMYLADHDLVKGKVVRDGCSAEVVLKYLRQRAKDPSQIDYSGVALPNTTLPIFIACAKLLQCEDLIDPYLFCWNKITTSIFIPQRGSIFGNETMELGINATRTVGRDFYSVATYCEEIASEHTPNFDRTKIQSDRGLLKCAAAYLYPSRFPWVF